MKKSNQLTVFVLFLFVASLVSCEKEKIAEEQEPAIATEIASIKEVKETFLKQNKSIHLFTGKSKNLQARNDSISNYFIDWKNTKKATFKEGVTILSTPVIRQFIDKRERSFIASFKNGDTIERSPFSGYLLKFKIDTEFEALYRYKEGVLVATYVLKKSKLQHRYDEGDCKPAPENMTTSLNSWVDEDEDYEGQGVVQFKCLLLTATVKHSSSSKNSRGESNGDVFTWHNPSRHLDNLLSNAFMRNHSNDIVGGGGGGSYNGDLNDMNESVDKVIDSLTGKVKCVYDKVKKLPLFKKTIGKFTSNPNYTLKIKEGKCANFLIDGCTDTDSIKKGLIVIKISRYSSNYLELATTILHEGLHAEINRFVYERSQGRNIKDSELKNKKRLMELYFEYKGLKNKSKQYQHWYMTENYVRPLAKSIRELDKFSYPLKYYMGFAWDGLRRYGIAVNLLDEEQDMIIIKKL